MSDLMDRVEPAAGAEPGGEPRTACRRSLAFYLPDLSGGGAERMTLTLIAELIARGARTTLLLGRAEGALSDQVPAGCETLVFTGGRTAAHLPQLVRFLRRRRPDVLLSGINHNNLVAMAAKLAAGSSTRLLVCLHNALSAESGSQAPLGYRVLPYLYRALAKGADRFVAVSAGVADDMAAVTGVRRDRIEVIWNPAVDAGFAARAAAPADHPWFGEPVPVFVTAGRLTEQKDHATLLRALRVRLAHGPARLLILGEGPARAGLEALAAELGVAPHVAFLGFVANPLPYMRQAAAFVLSSRYEGFGLVLAEAMGCGAPVVSTDCPHGPSEILAGGAFGVLTPVADAEALGLAMAGDLRARFPAAALRARAAEFSSARGADAYAALIERVIARGAR